MEACKGPEVIFHQFTGKWTQVPDPRGIMKDGRPVMVDDQPIFASYPGHVRGPFKVIKPAKMKQVGGVWEMTDPGVVEYSNDIYEVTKPKGNGWSNQAIKSWHLDVNFGTEYMPRVAYVENGLLQKDAAQFGGTRNWFEFVEKPAETVGAGAEPTQKTKGK